MIITTKKIQFIFLIILGFFISSCSNDEQKNNQNAADHNGTYIGNVNLYINNNFHSSQSKTITSSTSSNSGLFLMTNNIFMSTTCNINSNNLNIPRATTVTLQAFNVVEYGTGTFSGNNLTLEFNQEQVNPPTQEIRASFKWTGTLLKQ